MTSDPDSEYLAPGSLVDDKYEVRRLLGRGGMGAVVEATHRLRQARVALKFMSPHLLEIKGIVERFLNEGIAASRINSEHVVKVLDVSKLANGQPYLVMEFLDGEDLESLLSREGMCGLADVSRAVHIVLQVLRGLQVAHSAGIIHRDLKPANCFVVTQDGEPDFIKLVDFGISKVQDDSNVALTHEGSTMGTPLYVSLEQARNAANVDERSDLYSVAVILYELLCGHPPFLPTNMAELLYQLATASPPSLDELRLLPQGLAAVVQKGLERERVARYQSAYDFAAALAPYADERSALILKQLSHRGSARPSRPAPGFNSQTPSGTLIAARSRTANGSASIPSPEKTGRAPTLPATRQPSEPEPPPMVQTSAGAPVVIQRSAVPRWTALAVAASAALAGAVYFTRTGAQKPDAAEAHSASNGVNLANQEAAPAADRGAAAQALASSLAVSSAAQLSPQHAVSVSPETAPPGTENQALAATSAEARALAPRSELNSTHGRVGHTDGSRSPNPRSRPELNSIKIQD